MSQGWRLSPRDWLALGLMLLVELVIYLPFYAANPGTFPPWLFAAGVVATAYEFRWLLKHWQPSRSAWRRFGLCLIAAVVGFQIFIALFTLCTALMVFWQNPADAAGSVVGVLVFFAIMLVAANTFFFWVWIVVGAVAFAALQFLPGRPRASAAPPQPP